MLRYFFQVRYRGSRYHGWQRQKNAMGVQQVVEEALHKLYGQKHETVGAGRTDTGVHATAQWFHADLPDNFAPAELAYRMNKVLPFDIAIAQVRQAKADAHARFSATGRCYHYHILHGKNPFRHGLAYPLQSLPRLEHLQASSRYLLGTQDFTSFSKVDTDVNHYQCSIAQADWQATDDGLQFTIKADRFLRNMVRAIVGTSLWLDRSDAEPAAMAQVIAAKDRTKAGASAPAEGLFLVRVDYPSDIFVDG